MFLPIERKEIDGCFRGKRAIKSLAREWPRSAHPHERRRLFPREHSDLGSREVQTKNGPTSRSSIRQALERRSHEVEEVSEYRAPVDGGRLRGFGGRASRER